MLLYHSSLMKMRIDVDCGRLAMMPQSEQVRSRSSCGKIRLRYYLRATECIPTLTKPFYKISSEATCGSNATNFGALEALFGYNTSFNTIAL